MAQNFASFARAGSVPLSPVRQRGAWKLAYADFLTALCAFFLIMWLVHGVSSDSKADLAEQFGAPAADTASLEDSRSETLLAELRASTLIKAHPGIAKLATDGGSIRLDLVDLDRAPLFDKGHSTLNERGLDVVRLAAQAIAALDVDLSIEGHTDSDPVRRDGYSNWELSSDRANAARRELISSGVNAIRVRSVAGLADTRPLNDQQGDLPQNRRLSIVLHLD